MSAPNRMFNSRDYELPLRFTDQKPFPFEVQNFVWCIGAYDRWWVGGNLGRGARKPSLAADGVQRDINRCRNVQGSNLEHNRHECVAVVGRFLPAVSTALDP